MAARRTAGFRIGKTDPETRTWVESGAVVFDISQAEADIGRGAWSTGQDFASALAAPTPNLSSSAISPLGGGVPGEIAIGARRVAEQGSEVRKLIRRRDGAIRLIAADHQA